MTDKGNILYSDALIHQFNTRYALSPVPLADINLLYLSLINGLWL